jgi:hypothetical protein
MSWRHLLQPAGAICPPGETGKKTITVCRNGKIGSDGKAMWIKKRSGRSIPGESDFSLFYN